jgi:hypothetical protein
MNFQHYVRGHCPARLARKTLPRSRVLSQTDLRAAEIKTSATESFAFVASMVLVLAASLTTPLLHSALDVER